MKQQQDNLVSRDDTVVADDLALVVAVKGSASTPIPITPVAPVAATSTITRVPSDVVNTTLAAANPARTGLTVYNKSTANLFLKLEAGADIGVGTESYTVRLVPDAYYELPFTDSGVWTGVVDGIWDAADATGCALVGELAA